MRRGYAGGLLPSFSDAKLEIAIQAAAPARLQRSGVDSRSSMTGRRRRSLELSLREWKPCRHSSPAPRTRKSRVGSISIHTAKFHVASIVTKLVGERMPWRAMRLARAMI
jgi:hypothetical protein